MDNDINNASPEDIKVILPIDIDDEYAAYLAETLHLELAEERKRRDDAEIDDE